MNPPSLKKYWVGIDPGFEGAIGVITSDGVYVSVVDLPVHDRDGGRTRQFDRQTLARVITDILHGRRISRVLLEYPNSRPGEPPEASRRFGVGIGLLDGMFSYAGYPPTHVAPNKWKGRLGLQGKKEDSGEAKEQAVKMAETVIKGIPPGILRGSRGGAKDGRAEALLIAWEGLTSTREGLLAQPEDVRMMRLLSGGGKRRPKPRDL